IFTRLEFRRVLFRSIRRLYFKHWRILGNDRAARKQSIVPPTNSVALAGLLLGCPCVRLCLGNLATLCTSTHSNCRSGYLGLSLRSEERRVGKEGSCR